MSVQALQFHHLPKLPSATAALFNILARLQGGWPVVLPDVAAPVIIWLGRSVPAVHAVVALPLMCPYGQFVVHIQTDCADALSDIMLPGWRQEDPRALPLNWRMISLVSPLLAAVGIAPDKIVPGNSQIIVGFQPANPRILGARLTVEGRSYSVWIEAVDVTSEAPALLRSPQKNAGHSSHRTRIAQGIPLIIHLSVPTPPLLLRDLASLAPGDIILLPGSTAQSIAADVRFGNGRIVGQIWTESSEFLVEKILLKEPMMDTTDNDTLFDTLSTPSDETGYSDLDDNNTPLGIDDLPVMLEIVLASRNMRISDLADLAPGASLDLGADLTAPVRLRVNGQTLGTGRLVQIGERVGVQIEHWRWSQGDQDE